MMRLSKRKMKMKVNIPAILLAAIASGIISCRENVIQIDSLEKELFLQENTEGVYRNGKPLFQFKETSHQKAVNSSRLQYRIQTDEQDTCLNIILDALPRSAGVHITTSIDYRSPGELISGMSHFECSRREENRLWLWSSDNLTGIIVDISDMK